MFGFSFNLITIYFQVMQHPQLVQVDESINEIFFFTAVAIVTGNYDKSVTAERTQPIRRGKNWFQQ